MIFRRISGRRLGAATALSAVILSAQPALGTSFRKALTSHGIAYAGKGPYRVTLDRSLSEGGSRRSTAELGATRLRVASEPAPDAAAAGHLLAEWKTRLYGQFEGAMSYPGMVTRRFDVPKELHPRAVSVAGAGRSAWIVPATERLTFGAGADDLVRYFAVVTHRWCPVARRAVELTLFYPRESFHEEAALAEEAAFTCPRSSVPPVPPS